MITAPLSAQRSEFLMAVVEIRRLRPSPRTGCRGRSRSSAPSTRQRLAKAEQERPGLRQVGGGRRAPVVTKCEHRRPDHVLGIVGHVDLAWVGARQLEERGPRVGRVISSTAVGGPDGRCSPWRSSGRCRSRTGGSAKGEEIRRRLGQATGRSARPGVHRSDSVSESSSTSAMSTAPGPPAERVSRSCCWVVWRVDRDRAPCWLWRSRRSCRRDSPSGERESECRVEHLRLVVAPARRG